MTPKTVKRSFKVWVPKFRVYKITNPVVRVQDQLPVYATKKDGMKHWLEMRRATLTIDTPKKGGKKP